MAAQDPAVRQSQLEFLYCDPDFQHDIIVVFDLLDRVKAGFFHAVIIAPPASTWFRCRHFGSTQTPVRSRTQPLGLTSLGALARSRISEANRTLKVCTWLAQQALFASVPCVLMFPDDLGGHSYSGPSSPWALQDWRSLEGLGEAHRGSAFLCRLADADHRRRQASSQKWTSSSMTCTWVGEVCCQFNRISTTMARSTKFVLALLVMVLWLASILRKTSSQPGAWLSLPVSGAIYFDECCAKISFDGDFPGAFGGRSLLLVLVIRIMVSLLACTHVQQYLSSSSSASPRSRLFDFLSVVSSRVIGVPSRLPGSYPAHGCASASLSVTFPAAGLRSRVETNTTESLSGTTQRDTTPRKVPRTSEFPSGQLAGETRKSEVRAPGAADFTRFW